MNRPMDSPTKTTNVLYFSTFLLLLTNMLNVAAQSPQQLLEIRKALENSKNVSTTEAPVTEPTTRDPRLTGDPRHDYIYDPNLPRELNGHNLSTYPFYTSIPNDITFKCDGRLDGYYASIPHHCQLFHLCVHSLRHDFLCANYTVFDQTQFICHFVNSVNCSNSETFYERNNELYVTTTTTELPLYDDEYEEEPRTKRPTRRRKGGRRRKGRRRTTTTTTQANDDYYYDDYQDEEPLPLDEEIVEEETPKPKRTKARTTTIATTATTMEATEAPIPKINVQKVRRPQLRAPRPPTTPPVEEEILYDDVEVEQPIAPQEHPLEAAPLPQEPPPVHHDEVVDEGHHEDHGLSVEPDIVNEPILPARRPAPRQQLTRRIAPIAGVEEGAATGDVAAAVPPQRHRVVSEPGIGARPSPVADEIPASTFAPRHRAQNHVSHRPAQTEGDDVASGPLPESPPVARSPFRGSSLPVDDVLESHRPPQRSAATRSRGQQRASRDPIESEGATDPRPQRPTVRSAAKRRLPSPQTPGTIHGGDEEPVVEEEPRQPARRVSSLVPRRRPVRALPSSTAILPDPASVIAGILSGIGPNPPPEPSPKNKTGNETEAETERPAPPSSDSFVVAGILSGVGVAPSREGATVSSPRVSPRTKQPNLGSKGSLAGTTPIPNIKDETPRRNSTTSAPASESSSVSHIGDEKRRRVVKRRRKTRKPTTTTTQTPREEEYEYVE